MGEQGLAFLRARHNIGDPSGDIGRMDRQHAFLVAMVPPDRVDLAADQPAGCTDARRRDQVDHHRPGLGSLLKLKDLAQSLTGLKPANVTFLTIPWRDRGDGANVLVNTGQAATRSSTPSTPTSRGRRPPPPTPRTRRRARAAEDAAVAGPGEGAQRHRHLRRGGRPRPPGRARLRRRPSVPPPAVAAHHGRVQPGVRRVRAGRSPRRSSAPRPGPDSSLASHAGAHGRHRTTRRARGLRGPTPVADDLPPTAVVQTAADAGCF